MTAGILLRVSLAVVGAIALAVAYFIVRFVRHRMFYHNLPGPPHSYLFGHLRAVGEIYAKMPPGTYIQAAIGELHRKYQLGDIWYLDMWPVGLAMMMTCGPETTAISTTANIYPQASVVGEFFKSSTGTSFIEALNGNPWKQLHQMLAPGLTPGAVKTYFSDVVSRAAVLNRRLQRAAASGDIIDLYRMLSHYPAEVIGKVVFGEDVDAEGADAQLCEDLMVTAEKAGVANGTINPWTAWLMNRDIKRRVARISRNVEARVHRRFAELKQKKVLPNRSTATNLLDRMLVARVESGLPMDDALMTLLMDNIRGLLMAGFGTTGDTSSYMHMLLQAFPEARQKLREEHERVFGKDLETTLRMLDENPALLRELPYTDAVINETLRMYPIGVVARDHPPEVTMIEHNGQSYPFGNCTVIVASYIMHWDPKIFPEPSQFWPERFLETPSSDSGDDCNGSVDRTSATSSGDAKSGELRRHPKQPPFPRSAHRPFERGVRSCLGRHLAMDEMRLMLVVTARFFDFELVNHKPTATPTLSFTDHDTRIGIHAFQRARLTAGPCGPVWMKVRLAAGAAGNGDT